MTTKQMIEFTVIDSEPTGLASGKVMQADVTVARTRDLGSNDEQFHTKCHLGNILQSGDTVMGYDLSAAVYNEADHQKVPIHEGYSGFVLGAILWAFIFNIFKIDV